jgi:ribose-phosphate pyrophosphokinase
MLVFALNASRYFGEKVADCLGAPLADHEEREFEDGEHKARPLVSVRGRDVFVIQSLHGGPDHSANDKLCRLLFFLAAMREGGAARVTAVVPYLAYARKDRQTKSRDPVTTRYMAQILESVGIDGIMTMDVHNIVAYQNAFRCHAYHLDTRLLFARHVSRRPPEGDLVVASPDPGGVKRAQLFREMCEKVLGRPLGSAFMEKRRSAGVVSGTMFVGDVAGSSVLVIDDLISSGGTILRAAEACKEHGAASVSAFAGHGLFTGTAEQAVASPLLTGITVTDTVPPFRLESAVAEEHLEIVSAAPLFAEAIKRLHENGSLTDLLEGEG